MRPTTDRERRKHPRKPCRLPVDGLSGDSLFKGFVKNISLGGVFMETPVAFALDEEIVLRLAPPQSEEQIKVVGKIVWKDPDGVGVAFMDVPKRMAVMIDSLPEPPRPTLQIL